MRVLHLLQPVRIVTVVFFLATGTRVSAGPVSTDKPEQPSPTRTAVSPSGTTPYEGLIHDTDPRLHDIRQILLEGKPLPAFLSLRYRGTQGNFAVFYDLDGKEAFYQYRRDPFDDLASRKLKDLTPGQAYRVRGNYRGLLDEGIIQVAGNADYSELLASQRGRPVFEFLSAETIQPDTIFF